MWDEGKYRKDQAAWIKANNLKHGDYLRVIGRPTDENYYEGSNEQNWDQYIGTIVRYAPGRRWSRELFLPVEELDCYTPGRPGTCGHPFFTLVKIEENEV